MNIERKYFLRDLTRLAIERDCKYELKEIVNIDQVGEGEFKILANIIDRAGMEYPCVEYKIVFNEKSINILEIE